MDNSKSKRPRPVLSCFQCRNRKLKCNRAKPCEQCVKAGRPGECSFSPEADPPIVPDHGTEADLGENEPSPNPKKRPRPDAVEEIIGPRTKRDGGLGVIEDLQARVRALEERLSDQTSSFASNGLHVRSTAPAAASKYLGNVEVDGHRYRYRGQFNRAAVLNRFGEIRPFVQLALRDPRMGSIIKNISEIQKSFARKHNSYCAHPVPDIASALDKMAELLPTRFVADILVETYFTHWEKTLRVLHVPTFRQEYEAYWSKGAANANLSPGFLPQFVAILIIAFRMHSESQALLDRGFAYSAYAMLKAWQAQLIGKERSYFSNLQACTLLVIAGQTLPQPIDRMWMETGALLRHAMTLGLHVEPNVYPKLQIFHGEIRRRLWITIAELDIQSSLLSGMPPTLRAGAYGTNLPSNFDDNDLTEGMEELPEPRPLEEWTPTRPQIALAQSIDWRLRAAELCSRQKAEHDGEEEVAELETRLLEAIETQPQCLHLDLENFAASKHPDRVLGVVLLRLFSRRALLSMYRPVILSNGWNTKMRIRSKFFDSAIKILQYHDGLDPDSQEGNGLNTKACWAMLQNMCKQDIIQAAISVCFEIRCMNESLEDPDQAGPISLPVYNMSADLNASQPSTLKSRAWLIKLVINALHSIIRGISDHGNDIKDILMLAVVLESVRSNSSQADKHASMMDEVIRVINLARPHLQKPEALVKPVQGGYPLNLRNIPFTPSSNSATPSREPAEPVLAQQMDFAIDDFLNYDDFDFGFPEDWQPDPNWQ